MIFVIHREEQRIYIAALQQRLQDIYDRGIVPVSQDFRISGLVDLCSLLRALVFRQVVIDAHDVIGYCDRPRHLFGELFRVPCQVERRPDVLAGQRVGIQAESDDQCHKADNERPHQDRMDGPCGKRIMDPLGAVHFPDAFIRHSSCKRSSPPHPRGY